MKADPDTTTQRGQWLRFRFQEVAHYWAPGVSLRTNEQDARDAVAAHLVEIQAATASDSMTIVAAADCEPLGVVW